METSEILIQIKNDIENIKRAVLQTSIGTTVSDKWIPRAKVMEFLNYGDTQMASFEKNGEIQISRIGKRKFINRDSLAKFLDKHSTKQHQVKS